MWKGLSVLSDSPSPIVVVLSGSMEPAFQRGDLLLLWNRNLLTETSVGEVVVYNVKGKDIPIVHRVVRKFGSGYVRAAAVASTALTASTGTRRSSSPRATTMPATTPSYTPAGKTTSSDRTLLEASLATCRLSAT